MTKQYKMKLVRLVLAATLGSILWAGCSLMPRDVEYFQRKVRPVPELSDSGKEHQRQAAHYVAEKARQTKEAAIKTQADISVVVPATEASVVAQSLSGSLGPAKSDFIGTSTNLARSLDYDQAKLNSKISDYREHVEPDVGKSIDGTGLFQVGYFTNAAIILGVLALLWFGLKVYGVANPLVGGAVGVVGRVSSGVVAKGFSELIHGGERFKNYIESSGLPDEIQEKVKDLFSRAHIEAQSRDIQGIVATATRSQ
jgi:hypothetical protein